MNLYVNCSIVRLAKLSNNKKLFCYHIASKCYCTCSFGVYSTRKLISQSVWTAAWLWIFKDYSRMWHCCVGETKCIQSVKILFQQCQRSRLWKSWIKTRRYRMQKKCILTDWFNVSKIDQRVIFFQIEQKISSFIVCTAYGQEKHLDCNNNNVTIWHHKSPVVSL